MANRPVPIQDSWSVRVGIEVTLEVRVEAFTDDHVRDAISIEIGESGGMRFGERNISGVLGAEVTHDVVPDKADIAARVLLLFEPGEPPSMCSNRSHDVVLTVAVHVV